LLASRPNTKLEDTPCRMSVCFLFSILPANFHTCKPSPSLQPKDTPLCNDRDALSTVHDTILLLLLLLLMIILVILTYLLIPWFRVLLENLTGLQLVKKLPSFLWNPKFHYRTQKRPPPLPILGQPNPVHIPTSHLLKIHPNIIHPSTPRSPQWSLSFRFPH